MIVGNFYEVFNYQGAGYKTLHIFESWRVAGLRYAPNFEKENFYRIERHLKTDEVFVLLQGEAYLIVGDDKKVPECISAIKMEIGKVYNIKKNVWHHILTNKDANVFIAENSDTSPENSEYYEVTKEQKQGIIAQSNF